LIHREDGPAVEQANGRMEWWVNGRLHREDGPAVELADGTVEYWLNGEQVDLADLPKELSQPKPR
jgi:hypothetical protein